MRKVRKIIICMIPAYEKPQSYSFRFSNFELYYMFIKRFRKFGRISQYTITIKSAIALRACIAAGFVDHRSGEKCKN